MHVNDETPATPSSGLARGTSGKMLGVAALFAGELPERVAVRFRAASPTIAGQVPFVLAVVAHEQGTHEQQKESESHMSPISNEGRMGRRCQGLRPIRLAASKSLSTILEALGIHDVVLPA